MADWIDRSSVAQKRDPKKHPIFHAIGQPPPNGRKAESGKRKGSRKAHYVEIVGCGNGDHRTALDQGRQKGEGGRLRGRRRGDGNKEEHESGA